MAINFNDRKISKFLRGSENSFMTGGSGGNPVVLEDGEQANVYSATKKYLYSVIGNGVDDFAALKAKGTFQSMTPINITAAEGGRDLDNVGGFTDHNFATIDEAFNYILRRYNPPTISLSSSSFTFNAGGSPGSFNKNFEIGDANFDLSLQLSVTAGNKRAFSGNISEITTGTAFDSSSVSSNILGIAETASDPNNISTFIRNLLDFNHTKSVFNNSTKKYYRSFRGSVTDDSSPNKTTLSNILTLEWLYPMYVGITDQNIGALMDANNISSIKTILQNGGKLNNSNGLIQRGDNNNQKITITNTAKRYAYIAVPSIYGALSNIFYSTFTSANFIASGDSWAATAGASNGGIRGTFAMDEAASSAKWSGVNYDLYCTREDTAWKPSGGADYTINFRF